MIWDSVIWKKELRKEMLGFEKATSIHGINSEFLGFKTERFFFLSSYIIRKLLEADKLSNEVAFRPILVKYYGYISQEGCFDKLNNHHIDRFYDLDNECYKKKDLKWMCSKLIHSFCFAPLFHKKKFCGVFFNSDETKKEGLFYIDYKTYKTIVVSCIHDDIVFSSWNRVSGKKVMFSNRENAEKWMKKGNGRRGLLKDIEDADDFVTKIINGEKAAGAF